MINLIFRDYLNERAGSVALLLNDKKPLIFILLSDSYYVLETERLQTRAIHPNRSHTFSSVVGTVQYWTCLKLTMSYVGTHEEEKRD